MTRRGPPLACLLTLLADACALHIYDASLSRNFELSAPLQPAAAHGCARHASVVYMGMPNNEEDTRRDALLGALFSDDDELAVVVDPTEPSHMHLEVDEDGIPKAVQFAYVDEHTCIGCTYCAQIARNTFFMEPEHGRARSFNHGVDPIEVVNEAIASCPVNCIDYVTLEDLKTLELERADQQVNWKARLVGGDSAANFVPPTKAASYQDGPQGKCGDCPNRGCKTCPMFGVGENPVYMRMLKERERRRNESGSDAAMREAKERDAMLDLLTASEQPTPEVGEIPADADASPSQSTGTQPTLTSEAWQEQQVTQAKQTAVTSNVKTEPSVVLDEATMWNALFAAPSPVPEGDPASLEGSPSEEEKAAADF